MKRIICCLLAVLLLAVCLTGCKFMTLSDAEAQAELERLLPDAKILTEVFYGKGLPYEPLPEGSKDVYAFVSEDAPYQSVDALKAAAEKVFSEEYLQSIYAYAFDGNEYTASRYFTAKDEDGKPKLKINLQLAAMSVLQSIDVSSATVVEGTPAACVVKVKAVNGAGKQIDKQIKLVKKNNAWFLDGAAY